MAAQLREAVGPVPDRPGPLSFWLTAVLDMEDGARRALLSGTSLAERQDRLLELLELYPTVGAEGDGDTDGEGSVESRIMRVDPREALWMVVRRGGADFRATLWQQWVRGGSRPLVQFLILSALVGFIIFLFGHGALQAPRVPGIA